MKALRAGAVLGGTALGIALGLMAARRLGERHRADLFNPQPLRRLAALGYLARHAGIETVGLLRDYIVWERHGLLRQRGTALLKRLEARYAS